MGGNTTRSMPQHKSTFAVIRLFFDRMPKPQDDDAIKISAGKRFYHGFTMNLERTLQEIGRTMTIVSHERGHWLPGRPYDKGTALL